MNFFMGIHAETVVHNDVWGKAFRGGEELHAATRQTPSCDATELYARLNGIGELACQNNEIQLATVCYALAKALERAGGAGTDVYVDDIFYAVKRTCSQCGSRYMVRYYRVIQHNSAVAADLENVNVAACYRCGRSMRISNPVALVNVPDRKIVVYVAAEHKNTWTEWMAGDIKTYLAGQDTCAVETVDEWAEFCRVVESPRGAEMVRVRPDYTGISNAMNILRYLGATYLRHGDYERAANAYGTCVAYDPADPVNYRGLAAVYSAAKQHDAALTMLMKAQSITDDEAGYVVMPKVKGGERVPEPFASQLTSGSKFTPISREKNEEIYGSVIYQLQTYLEEYPDEDQQMVFFLGVAFMKIEQFRNMINALLKAIAIMPQRSQVADGARLLLQLKTGKGEGYTLTQYLERQVPPSERLGALLAEC